MTATTELLNGIPHPARAGRWIVPPWPSESSLCDVVAHFLRFAPSDHRDAVRLLAYFEGYQAAVDAAPTHELIYPCDWHWYEDLRRCIGRCVELFREPGAMAPARRG